MLLYEDLVAARHLHKALSVNADFLPALVCMGELLRFTGKTEKATGYYTKALTIDSKQPLALKGLAKALYHLGDKKTSI